MSGAMVTIFLQFAFLLRAETCPLDIFKKIVAEPFGGAGIEQMLKVLNANQKPAVVRGALASQGLENTYYFQTGVQAEGTTGDLVRILPLEPGGKTRIFLGDSTGHGLKAAKDTVNLHLLMDKPQLRATLTLPAITDVLRRLDRVQPQMMGDGRYPTMAVVDINPQTWRFRFALAGAPPPIVVKKDGRIEVFGERGRRPPLGISLGHGDEATGALEPGDSLILFTDGITDGYRPGTEKIDPIDLRKALEKSLAENPPLQPLTPQRLGERIRSLNSQPFDDQTLLIIQRPH